jgi:hypothetical protein
MVRLEQWAAWTFPNRGRFTRDWKVLARVQGGEVPDRPGVYLLAAPSATGSLVPRAVGRLLATDPNGVLDIGEATNLRSRLRSLHECATTRGVTGHMAGWRLGTLDLLKRLECTGGDLLVSWCCVADKRDAYEWEGWLLRTYFELFGELPPLNYKFNWSAFTDEELR